MTPSEATDPPALGMIEGVPPYAPDVVDGVARFANIRSIELVHSLFSTDEAPFRSASAAAPIFEVGVQLQWELSPDGSQLGCVLSFATLFSDDPSPYEVLASFRMIYGIQDGADLAPDAIEQFIWWDVVFTAWPYWREHLASITTRAGLDYTPVSSLPIPRRAFRVSTG